MAKSTKSQKSPAKRAKADAPYFDPKVYTKCNVGSCRRSIADTKAHIAAHKSGKIGDDGKRTDRKAPEKAGWHFRYNGRESTEKYRDVPFEKRAKIKL